MMCASLGSCLAPVISPGLCKTALTPHTGRWAGEADALFWGRKLRSPSNFVKKPIFTYRCWPSVLMSIIYKTNYTETLFEILTLWNQRAVVVKASSEEIPASLQLIRWLCLTEITKKKTFQSTLKNNIKTGFQFSLHQ